MFNIKIYIKQETSLFPICQSCWIYMLQYFFLLSQNCNNEKNYAQLDDSRIIQIYMTSLK